MATAVPAHAQGSGGLTLDIEFDPSEVSPGGTTRLILTSTNGFTSDLTDTGLLQYVLPSGFRPFFSGIFDVPRAQFAPEGCSTARFSAFILRTPAFGTLAAGESCSFYVMLTIPAETETGTYTIGPIEFGAFMGATFVRSVGTSASLEVIAAQPTAPTVAKAFSPASIPQGGTTRATVTIDNSANGIAATGLAFTDMLPTGLAVADTPNVVTEGCGATATASGNSISLTGGTVAAGMSCTVSVNLRATEAGTLTNPTFTVTSSLPAATALAVGLTVNPAVAPAVTKAFSPAGIPQGGTTRATVTIDNSANAIAAAGLAFTDTLPTGLAVADTPNVATEGCGATATAGGNSISLTGGTVAAGMVCTVSVDLRATEAGTLTNPTFPVTSSLPAATALAVDLTVNPASAPVVTKAFLPAGIPLGGTTRATVTIDSSANAIAATGLAFTDILPTGLAVADTPAVVTEGCGAVPTANAGSQSISLTGGTVAAGMSCTVSVNLRATEAGTLTNPTFTVTSSLPAATAPAVDLTVNPAGAPVVTNAFSPASIPQGGTTRATVTIDNSANGIAATGLAFTDTLPTGLAVADTPNVETEGCGATATAGGNSISLTGGTVAAGMACMVSVDLHATEAGTLTNPTFIVTSSLPAATAPAVDLTVNPASAPVVTKAFLPAGIPQGETTRATVTIDSSANAIAATGLAFTDILPTGLAVADTPAVVTEGCGAVPTANAGSQSISLTGGTVAAGMSCTVSVNLRATEAGTLTNPTFTVTSSLPAATAPAVDLTVNPAGAPVVTKAFSPASIPQGGTTRATVTIDNSANGIAATGLAFTDTLPAGLAVADTPAVVTEGCGAVPTAGGNAISLTGGTVAAGMVCTVSVDLRANEAGTLTNPTFTVTSSLPNATAPAVGLTVNPAVAPAMVTKVFSPAGIPLGGTTRATVTLDNSTNGIAATGLAFIDVLPTGLAVTDPPNIETEGCGAVPTAGGNTISLTGGTVAAGMVVYGFGGPPRHRGGYADEPDLHRHVEPSRRHRASGRFGRGRSADGDAGRPVSWVRGRDPDLCRNAGSGERPGRYGGLGCGGWLSDEPGRLQGCSRDVDVRIR